jgi:hypothetical protein
MKIVFPYFYGLHQLYHTAVTAMKLSRYLDNAEILCLSTTKDQTNVLKKIKSFNPDSTAQIIELPQPFRFKYLNIKKKKYPYVRSMVKKAKKILNSADIIVTTSHGTYNMFHHYKIENPSYIYQYHGMGDRKYGFDPRLSKYDIIMVGGEYHYNRLIKEKIGTPEKVKIVGYPKFDFPIETEKIRNELFKNDKPIVLYAPHWQPKLTSYKKFAVQILEFFSKNKNYNLIFAPHILLSHWKVRMGYNTNLKHYETDNIIIDFGSDYTTNGTYLKISDIYMGDVSSMVYEFIARKPRPCLFFNAHNVDWKDNVDYRFWNYGPVINHIDELKEKIDIAVSDKHFLELQKENVKKYIQETDENPSDRAAKVIANFAYENYGKI